MEQFSSDLQNLNSRHSLLGDSLAAELSSRYPDAGHAVSAPDSDELAAVGVQAAGNAAVIALLPLDSSPETRHSLEQALRGIASTGQDVVVVDMDIADPHSALLGRFDSEGVSDHFLYGVSPDKLLVPSPELESLRVLPPGTFTPRAAEIYTDSGWKSLIENLATQSGSGTVVLLAPPADKYPSQAALAGVDNALCFAGRLSPEAQALLPKTLATLTAALPDAAGLRFVWVDTGQPESEEPEPEPARPEVAQLSADNISLEDEFDAEPPAPSDAFDESHLPGLGESPAGEEPRDEAGFDDDEEIYLPEELLFLDEDEEAPPESRRPVADEADIRELDEAAMELDNLQMEAPAPRPAEAPEQINIGDIGELGVGELEDVQFEDLPEQEAEEDLPADDLLAAEPEEELAADDLLEAEPEDELAADDLLDTGPVDELAADDLEELEPADDLEELEPVDEAATEELPVAEDIDEDQLEELEAVDQEELEPADDLEELEPVDEAATEELPVAEDIDEDQLEELGAVDEEEVEAAADELEELTGAEIEADEELDADALFSDDDLSDDELAELTTEEDAAPEAAAPDEDALAEMANFRQTADQAEEESPELVLDDDPLAQGEPEDEAADAGELEELGDLEELADPEELTELTGEEPVAEDETQPAEAENMSGLEALEDEEPVAEMDEAAAEEPAGEAVAEEDDDADAIADALAAAGFSDDLDAEPLEDADDLAAADDLTELEEIEPVEAEAEIEAELEPDEVHELSDEELEELEMDDIEALDAKDEDAGFEEAAPVAAGDDDDGLDIPEDDELNQLLAGAGGIDDLDDLDGGITLDEVEDEGAAEKAAAATKKKKKKKKKSKSNPLVMVIMLLALGAGLFYVWNKGYVSNLVRTVPGLGGLASYIPVPGAAEKAALEEAMRRAAADSIARADSLSKIPPPPDYEKLSYSLQIGSFRFLAQAIAARDRLLQNGLHDVYVVPLELDSLGNWNRLYLGMFESAGRGDTMLLNLQAQLNRAGIGRGSIGGAITRHTPLTLMVAEAPSSDSLQGVKQKLEANMIPSYVVKMADQDSLHPSLYRLYSGAFENEEQAVYLRNQIFNLGVRARVVEREGPIKPEPAAAPTAQEPATPPV